MDNVRRSEGPCPRIIYPNLISALGFVERPIKAVLNVHAGRTFGIREVNLADTTKCTNLLIETSWEIVVGICAVDIGVGFTLTNTGVVVPR
jgi:hypothetical protein